ncbi:MAG: hypothetical protein COB60_01120 [Flavobacteriaceae bacterium]|nr:MAG: hypothetical protein COB60_01120 [Flavobacteriaceae bacterium]
MYLFKMILKEFLYTFMFSANNYSMKKLILLNFFILALFNVSAQNLEIHKLKSKLSIQTTNNPEKVTLLNSLAEKHFAINKDTALQYATKGLDLAENINYKKGIAQSFKLLGTYNYHNFDYPKAIEFYKKSLSLYEEIEEDIGKSKCLYNIGLMYWKQSDYEKSLEYYNKSLSLFETIGDNPNIAKCLNNIGLIYWNLGEYDKSLDYYDKSIMIFEELNNKIGIAQCLFNIGQIYLKRGNHSVALDYCIKSLVIVEELGDKQRIAKRLNFIGLIHFDRNNYMLAIENNSKSLKIFEELQDREGIASCLNNFGRIYMRQGKLILSIESYKEALYIFEEINYKSGISDALFNIGFIHSNEGNYNLALETFYKCLTISEKIEDNERSCSSLWAIANVYLIRKELDKALSYSHKSLIIANKMGLLSHQKNIREQLSTIYATLKNYDKAYENYVLYKELNDRIFNEDNIRKITDLKYQYEFDKANQAIALEQQKKDAIAIEKSKRQRTLLLWFILVFILMTVLVVFIFRSNLQKRKANVKLVMQKEQIEAANKVLTVQRKELQDVANELKTANKTKDKFFSIIAHDLRGPLGNLMSFGEILSKGHTEIEEETKKRYIEIIAKEAKMTFNLLNNLLKWASSNIGSLKVNPERIIINNIVKENLNLFKTSAVVKEITLKESLSEKIEFYADYDMINTVMRNLISNAIKFTSAKGTVEILARKISNKRIEIGISDSGIGIEANALAKLFNTESHFTTPGTINEKGSGLGLKLCKEFIDRNDGEIFAESELGIGTTIWISLPLVAYNMK